MPPPPTRSRPNPTQGTATNTANVQDHVRPTSDNVRHLHSTNGHQSASQDSAHSTNANSRTYVRQTATYARSHTVRQQPPVRHTINRTPIPLPPPSGVTNVEPRRLPGSVLIDNGDGTFSVPSAERELEVTLELLRLLVGQQGHLPTPESPRPPQPPPAYDAPPSYDDLFK